MIQLVLEMEHPLGSNWHDRIILMAQVLAGDTHHLNICRATAPLLSEPGNIAYLTSRSLAAAADDPWHILLVHANGFIKEMWFPVMDALRRRGVTCPITALDLRQHGDSAAAAVNDWWYDLPKDVAAVVQKENAKSPTKKPYRWLAVGHSMGGSAVVYAECQKPGTFEFIFVYEPIILTYSKLGKTADPSPELGILTRKRLNDFSSLSEAHAYFKSRPLFSSWNDNMLRLYASFGLKPKPGNSSRFELKCDPSTGEAKFFDVGGALPKEADDMMLKIRAPVVVLRGEKTVGLWKKLGAVVATNFASPKVHVMLGLGHLGLMENPEQFSQVLFEELTAFFATQKKPLPTSKL